ncbi:hypothetical protein GMO_12010 [Gluconobacter morbifer G707]|uniref:Uncharacterized protein n=1 Tax=Gluconobacter morbifer G707 TaxID=1088869 RepID=G6XHZ1_9PROT|nr:hypothetical protein GMO_12010 [Gluconobacter morbifer G707]
MINSQTTLHHNLHRHHENIYGAGGWMQNLVNVGCNRSE